MSLLLAFQGGAPSTPTRVPRLLRALLAEVGLDETPAYLLWHPLASGRRLASLQVLGLDEPIDGGWPHLVGGLRDVPVIVTVTRRRMPPLIRSKVRRGPNC